MAIKFSDGLDYDSYVTFGNYYHNFRLEGTVGATKYFVAIPGSLADIFKLQKNKYMHQPLI
jgi:hypothetical protein